MKQLSVKEVRGYREDQLERQRGVCSLCGLECAREEAALDHNHKSGQCRGVLHRWCNSVLGRIENWAKRSGHPAGPVAFLEGVVQYLKQEELGVLHPNHGRKRTRRKKNASSKRPQRKKSASKKRVRVRR